MLIVRLTYRAVPPPNPQCTTLQIYAIVQAIFNISSDLMMLAISIAMVATLQRPMKQKIGVGLMLGLGVFVVGSCAPSNSLLTPHIVSHLLSLLYLLPVFSLA